MREAATQPSDPGTSPTLAVAGLLMLVTTLLGSNPYNGVVRKWPWEMFAQTDDLLRQVTFVLWLVTGITALALAFLNERTTRSTLLLVLGSAVVATSCGVGAAFAVSSFNLSELLVFILLGAGLWLGATEGPRALAVAMTLMGALLFFWIMAISNDADYLRPRLFVLCEEALLLIQGKDVRPLDEHYVAWRLVPYLMFATSALAGMVYTMWRSVWVARIGWMLLAIAMAYQIRVALGDGAAVNSDTVTRAIFEGMGEAGLVVWLLGMYTIADVAREREAA